MKTAQAALCPRIVRVCGVARAWFGRVWIVCDMRACNLSRACAYCAWKKRRDRKDKEAMKIHYKPQKSDRPYQGIHPAREYRGMNVEFVDNKCDVCASGVCVTITRPREHGGAWTIDFYPLHGKAHIALIFPWEKNEKQSAETLVRRSIPTWREVCGYLNAVKQGLFSLRTFTSEGVKLNDPYINALREVLFS